MVLGNDLKSFEKLLASILVVSALCLLTTCSNAKFAGQGGSEQGGDNGKATEQPTDIAGGFGLTCLASDLENSNDDYNVGCRFTAVDGSQLKPSDAFEFDIKVKNNQNDVAIRKEPKGEKYTFDFEVPKSDVAQVKIESAAKDATENLETIKAIDFELSKVVTLPAASDECGGVGNSCYALPNLKPGDKKTITGTTERIEYVTIGGRGYWRSLSPGSDRILNFTGFWDISKNLSWQKKLTSDGRTYSATDFLIFNDLYKLDGRSCPGKVFTGSDDEGETGRCIYFKQVSGLWSLLIGSVASSWTTKKWFSANHSECAALGMRLPTLYELEGFKDASQDTHLPPNAPAIRAVAGSGINYIGGNSTYYILTATTGKKAATECSGNDCYAGVSETGVSAIFHPASSLLLGTLYCVLH